MNQIIYKITITGPESSGKTTLARQLAEAFDTLWVPEYAREYIDQLNRPYRESDLLEIAKGQVAREDEYAEKRRKQRKNITSMPENYFHKSLKWRMREG